MRYPAASSDAYPLSAAGRRRGICGGAHCGAGVYPVFGVLFLSGRVSARRRRKRVQFMYPGRLQSIRLRYTGSSVEAILDRLPTAKIVSQDANGYLVEAEIYGNGIVMWLLSQGNRVEVLAPQTLREEMFRVLTAMLERYQP